MSAVSLSMLCACCVSLSDYASTFCKATITFGASGLGFRLQSYQFSTNYQKKNSFCPAQQPSRIVTRTASQRANQRQQCDLAAYNTSGHGRAEYAEEVRRHLDVNDQADYIIGYLNKRTGGKCGVDVQLFECQWHHRAQNCGKHHHNKQ